MQNITFSKVAGESYKLYSFKCYEARRNGEVVSTVAQDLGGKWEVVTADFNRVSSTPPSKRQYVLPDRCSNERPIVLCNLA